MSENEVRPAGSAHTKPTLAYRIRTEERAALIAILVACVVIRLLFAVIAAVSQKSLLHGGDSYSYINPAKSLLDHHVLNTRTNSPRPEIFRTPGYPVFIAAIWFVFGRQAIAVVIGQILINTGVAWMVYKIGKRWWNAQVGLISAAIIAIDPYQIRATGWMMTEIVAGGATVAVVYFGYRLFAQGEQSWRDGLGVGVSVAIATMIRQTTYYFPIVVLGFVAITTIRRRACQQLIVVSLLIVVPMAVIVGGWQWRNHERANTWRFSGQDAVVLYYYRGGDIVAQRDGISWSLASRRLEQKFYGLAKLPKLAKGLGNQIDPPPQGKPLARTYDRMYDAGIRVIRNDPKAATIAALTGSAYMAIEPGTVTMELPKYFHLVGIPGLKIGLAGALAMFYGLAAYGIVLTIRRNKRNRIGHGFALALVVYIFAISHNESGARFRVPVSPILTLFVACAIAELLARRKAGRVSAHTLIAE